MLIAGDNWITYEDEKRRDERFMSHAPVSFSIFSSRFHREYPISGWCGLLKI